MAYLVRSIHGPAWFPIVRCLSGAVTLKVSEVSDPYTITDSYDYCAPGDYEYGPAVIAFACPD